ncbi:MAG: hypothetical protein BWZ10_02259 [candidate division BRC1 bacterium ADurb.BinA364]|nr:MAG: hypothetical protein BWZ10_02259 [candidate division BRC1 bacterium ADurb.BinA364]
MSISNKALIAIAAIAAALAAPARGAETFADRVIAAALNEVRVGVVYDASYVALPYPAGDVPASFGACTDLLTRAYRNAGIDLQAEIYLDRKANFSQYPPTPKGEKPGPNPDIDHRRCRNLIVWFEKKALKLTTSLKPEDLGEWQAGDVVFLHLNKTETSPGHVAIVHGSLGPDGTPRIIDNFPPGAAVRFTVGMFPRIHSHYRWPSSEPAGEPIAPRYPGAATDNGAE